MDLYLKLKMVLIYIINKMKLFKIIIIIIYIIKSKNKYDKIYINMKTYMIAFEDIWNFLSIIFIIELLFFLNHCNNVFPYDCKFSIKHFRDIHAFFGLSFLHNVVSEPDDMECDNFPLLTFQNHFVSVIFH